MSKKDRFLKVLKWVGIILACAVIIYLAIIVASAVAVIAAAAGILWGGGIAVWNYTKSFKKSVIDGNKAK